MTIEVMMAGTYSKSSNWLNRKYTSWRRDPKAILLGKLLNFHRLCQLWPSTMVCRLVAWAWGIKLGSGCQFYGLTYFQRYPISSILIGEECTFRSAFTSNLVGLNHGCAISSYSETAKLQVGSHCGFSGTVIAVKQSIIIGENVFCGANTTITDFDWHAIDPDDRLDSKNVRSAPIIIENNVWLGLNCLVLKGVHIGENSVIGANSVVTKSLPANVIAAGNPARVIRSLSDD